MAPQNIIGELYPPVPAGVAVARFLDAHDQGEGVFITHLDATPRRGKMCVI
jgi:hypothetical protein